MINSAVIINMEISQTNEDDDLKFKKQLVARMELTYNTLTKR